MTVILVTQEAGSRGQEIAAGVANCLGIELVSRRRLERCIAHRMQVAEATVRRICKGKASLLERWMIDGRRLERCMAQEVMELAARDDVLIQTGRVAPLLRLIKHVICVHVCATGASLTTESPNKSGTVEPGVHQGDSARPWLRRPPCDNKCARLHLYDLVINTERIPVAQCVEQVRRLAQCPQFQPTPASRAVLANLWQETQQRSNPNEAPEPLAREVIVNSCRVKLTGVTDNEQAIARIEDHLRGEKLAEAPGAHSLPPAGLFG
jgi:cytidylate kinase